MAISSSHLKFRAQAAFELLVGTESKLHAKSITEFAKKHDFIYFKSVSTGSTAVPIIRGSTAAADQSDRHICIGSHESYDVTFFERTASVAFDPYESSRHIWSVMSFDLHVRRGVPMIFVGTQQLSKTFYARLLATRHELRHLHADALPTLRPFQGKNAVLAAPAGIPDVQTLFDEATSRKIAKHPVPFAIEIDQDTLTIFTDHLRTGGHSLDHMLSYGLWLAKHIDERL